MNDSQNIAFVPSLRLTRMTTCTHCLPHDWLTWTHVHTAFHTTGSREHIAFLTNDLHEHMIYCLPHDSFTWTHCLPYNWFTEMQVTWLSYRMTTISRWKVSFQCWSPTASQTYSSLTSLCICMFNFPYYLMKFK